MISINVITCNIMWYKKPNTYIKRIYKRKKKQSYQAAGDNWLLVSILGVDRSLTHGILHIARVCVSVGWVYMSVGCVYVSVGWVYMSVGCVCVSVGWVYMSVGCVCVSVGWVYMSVGYVCVSVGWVYMGVGCVCVSVGWMYMGVRGRASDSRLREPGFESWLRC